MRQQLWGMWSSVLAWSRRTLCVKSGGGCNGGSSARGPGSEGALWSSATASPASAVGAPRDPMMVSPTARGRAGVACSHRLQTLAPDRRRPPQEGVKRVTGSIGTPAMAFAAPAGAVMEGREGWGRRWRSGARHDWGCHSRLYGCHAGTCKKSTVHDLDRPNVPRNWHRGQQRRTAARRSRRSGERGLRRCGRQASGRASR